MTGVAAVANVPPVAAVAINRQEGAEASLPTEDARWKQWKAQGRADDLRFGRRLRTILVDVVAAVAVGGALWFAFQY